MKDSITKVHHPNVFMPSKRSLILAKELAKLDLRGKKVLDIGTGLGILSLVAASQGANLVVATDINPFALTFTKENWIIKKLANKLVLLKTDALEEISKQRKWRKFFDLVISNPPMLPRLFSKKPKAFATVPGFWNETDKNGRHVVDSLIIHSPRILNRGGRLIFTHSSRLGKELTTKLLNKHFSRWSVILEKPLKLEKRFLPFLHFWSKNNGMIFRKGQDFFEVFSIIEATKNGQN